jgi:quercetin dioxygenase-like cupin family protein
VALSADPRAKKVVAYLARPHHQEAKVLAQRHRRIGRLQQSYRETGPLEHPLNRATHFSDAASHGGERAGDRESRPPHRPVPANVPVLLAQYGMRLSASVVQSWSALAEAAINGGNRDPARSEACYRRLALRFIHADQLGDRRRNGALAKSRLATQWGPAPPTLPKGSKVAVLLGDPSKPGPFVLRIWAPPHSVVPPHTHNAPEMLTVISGEMYHEMGPKLDKKGGDSVKAGGFVYLPAQMAHSTWTGDEITVVQVSGTGPFGINYINPADDPSKQQ